MRQEERRISSSDLRNNVGKILEDVLRGRATIVERYERPIGVFISFEDYERLQALDEREKREREE
jgi:prevent-host-death family protein